MLLGVVRCDDCGRDLELTSYRLVSYGRDRLTFLRVAGWSERRGVRPKEEHRRLYHLCPECGGRSER